MKRLLALGWLLSGVLLVGSVSFALADGETMSDREREKLEAQKAAEEFYPGMEKAFLLAKWDEFDEKVKESSKHYRFMTKEQQANVRYMREASQDCRPKWWKDCRSSTNRSFKAEIWNRTFMANYMPSDMLGMMAPVGYDQERKCLHIIVTWKPNLVENADAVKGWLATKHGISQGNLAEAIIWHELGHNYVTLGLPIKAIIQLWWDHSVFYSHLQEFYADLTAIYHASTRGRLTAMMFRLDGFDWYRETECHDRAAHAIGAIITSEWLANPDKWPSIHFPPEVPKEKIELKTIIYLYENIDPNWTLAEDQALRDIVKTFVAKSGEKVLTSRGKIPLSNKQTFMLLVNDDREEVAKREKWIKERLEAIIQSGRADKAPDPKEKKKEGHEKLTRGDRIQLPW